MKDAQKPDHVSFATLINRLREGRYVIPDFQRDFEWKPWDIRELMRSIFLDYYIGSLLFWKGEDKSFKQLACEPLYGFQGSGDPTHIVLDGQQRLTAMYYAFVAPDVSAPGRHNRFLYFIDVNKFMEEAYDDAFDYHWTRRGINLLENQEAQFENHMFPLAVIGRGGWQLAYWVQAYEKFWTDRASAAREAGDDIKANASLRHALKAKEFGEHLRGISEQYQIAFIELDRDLEIEKVCDIFTQINSRGIRLDVFDLINALLKPKGVQLKRLWREAAPRLDFVETERTNVYVLQVMSILRQSYCSPKYLYYLLPGQERKIRETDGSLRTEVLVRDKEDFLTRWNGAVEALQRAIDLLRHPQEFGAISSRYLPYASILPVFASLQTAAQELPPNRRLDAQRKIRHWYWASVFMNRYSGAVESTSARDYQDVRAWFNDDAAQPGLIDEFHSRFRNLDLRRETKRGTSIYNGIFNLLVLRGARDWMADTVPQYNGLDDHHIVPKSWNKSHEYIDSILNRTPLTAETNRNVINDRLPNQYLAELIEQNGESAVRAVLESHFISSAALQILMRDPFTEADFEAFLAERQRTVHKAIEDLLIKERLDLSPQLRELDAEVEKVELALRQVVLETLDGQGLPPHVLQKIEERIQTASRKNAAFDQERYDTLAGKLEYADLRELETTLTSKSLWHLFEKRFANKSTLIKRFDQLAELRNAIRHSRTVDEVTRKEGEAALMWFDQVLGKGAFSSD